MSCQMLLRMLEHQEILAPASLLRFTAIGNSMKNITYMKRHRYVHEAKDFIA